MAVPIVMGTEIEYGITVQNDPDFDSISSTVLIVNAYREDEPLETLWDYDQESPLSDARGFQVEGERYTPDQEENIARNKTLINGARFYVDHAHPEYSSPEVTTAREATVHEKAGERVLELARREACAILPPDQKMLIYKNNSDRKGNSYGSHENYLMDRRTPFKQVTEHITPFFVTRQIYCGAGKVGSENGAPDCKYQIAQRSDFFEVEVSLDTMVKRPIVNTRDEPHAERDDYRRLHVIVGDSNLSEYTIYLRNGVTALVLQMIQDGAIDKKLTLRDPVRSICEVSHDVTCRNTVSLANGKKLSPIEIQKEYLDAAHRFTSGQPLGPETADILEKWEYVLNALEEDPMSLSREIDWVIKKTMIESFMERKGLDWNSSQVGMLDLQYHDIRLEKGLYFLLERQGKVERILTDEEIQYAIHHPPEDTRAYFRGECLRRYPKEVFGVNWDSISFGIEDQPIKRIMMSEPLKGTKKHVEQLFESSPTAKDLIENLKA
jgi:proteasome accessory factor PafA2